MTKKKMLIVHPSMVIGGAERALLGLLNSIDYELYNVDLLLCAHTGDFMPLINGNVRLLPYDRRYDFFLCPVSQLVKNGQWLKAFLRLLAKNVERNRARKMNKPHSVWHAQQIIHRFIAPLTPKVKGEYDLAINFLGIPSIVAEKVRAKVKMAWIHTDYSRIVADPKLDRAQYDKINWIVNVSDDCKRIFDSYYPEYKDKSIVIENILNTKLVRRMAEEPTEIPFTNSTVNLLSIGRFGEAKNFETIPYYCRKMIDSGVTNFKWYIIGYGGGENLIRANIEKYSVNQHIEILGKRVNPYPYIAACDIYLQPSRFEGKAVTVREAQMLGKPVIVTNYSTAASQIIDRVDGLIFPMDKDDFSLRLSKTLNDPTSLKSIKTYCESHSFGNESELEKIYHCIAD